MSPAPLRLASQVYAAVDGHDLVLLDVGRDAYFCLPDGGRDLAVGFMGRELCGLPAELATDLQDMGLIGDRSDLAWRPRIAPSPAADLGREELPRTTLLERADFAQAFAWMAVTYWRQPFARLIRARPAPRLTDDTAPERLHRRALAFRALLPWAPVQGACLFQAFLLRAYLAQVGLSADWVFGVKTWPFAAHCWLQAGDLVLNDTVEGVSAYRPILTV